jgi:hypothetical protein
MAAEKLETRVAALEAEVARLRLLVEKEKDIPWWHKIYGAFEGDPHFKEAMELGRQYRESLRPKPKKKKRKSKNGDS